MKKCCLNCAFCVRRKEKVAFNGLDHNLDVCEDILSSQERKLAEKNDFSFIGKEQRAQKAWKELYDKNLNILKTRKVMNGPRALELLQAERSVYAGGERNYCLKDVFQMGDMPEVPDEDYLACWHDLWNFKEEQERIRSINLKTKCLFFYPYTKKGHKSFEGCNKEREALLDQERYKTTNFWVIIGIIVGLVTSVCIYSCQQKDNQQYNNTLNAQMINAVEKLDNIEKISLDTQNKVKDIEKLDSIERISIDTLKQVQAIQKKGTLAK